MNFSKNIIRFVCKDRYILDLYYDYFEEYKSISYSVHMQFSYLSFMMREKEISDDKIISIFRDVALFIRQNIHRKYFPKWENAIATCFIENLMLDTNKGRFNLRKYYNELDDELKIIYDQMAGSFLK